MGKYKTWYMILIVIALSVPYVTLGVASELLTCIHEASDSLNQKQIYQS